MALGCVARGVERTVFYFVCVGAVGAFNLLNSLLAGLSVFIGGYIFGRWITATDPAFLKIMGQVRTPQDALRRSQTASFQRRGTVMFRLDRIIKPWKDAGSLNANVNLYGSRPTNSR